MMSICFVVYDSEIICIIFDQEHTFNQHEPLSFLLLTLAILISNSTSIRAFFDKRYVGHIWIFLLW